MSTVYLFRIDAAKDNDAFFASLRSSAAQVYAGIDLPVGASDWVPDLVRVVVEDPPDRCSLTLIELEATESVALISCRKYLPENSSDILEAFHNYLNRVIRQCRSKADPREGDFARLKDALSEAVQVAVTTAGAIRSSARFVEELPLLDQPKCATEAPPIHKGAPTAENRSFHGVLRLSQNERKALSRCVLVLDAVVRNFDHSDATFKNWRGQDNSQPLKYFLKRNPGIHPTLRSFILETGNRGVTLDFEIMIDELVALWSSAPNVPPHREWIRGLMLRYYPIASQIKSHETMPRVFETANKQLSEHADQSHH